MGYCIGIAWLGVIAPAAFLSHTLGWGWSLDNNGTLSIGQLGLVLLSNTCVLAVLGAAVGWLVHLRTHGAQLANPKKGIL
jgi:hypothetical protein